MPDRKFVEMSVREDDSMVKKLVLYLLHFLLKFISDLILFSCTGYFIFFCDWNVTMMGEIIYGILIALSVTVSLGFYWAGAKLRRIY
ncbi:hypothetical protein [Pantoea eucalypti]|jgi:hypothetical protein|uniref:hypothetical protein n=1 Tax=Pantoea eucalypti TaxID=470933 RepID=UPI0024B8BC0B|nr:hypothetical protein [Pantoea eucalypti]MDJ0472264.1 hypothetical protein [Pantoea eucalypti]